MSMEKNLEYEKIIKASKVFIEGVKRKDSTAKISRESEMPQGRIKQWCDRYNSVLKKNYKNKLELVYISNLTYGVSEDVWNRWICAIDSRMEAIKKCRAFSNEILEILEDIARQINTAVAPRRGPTKKMVNSTLAYFIDQTREQS